MQPNFPDELQKELFEKAFFIDELPDKSIKVRGIFFDFFCKLLRHFNTGITESDFRVYGKPDECLPDNPDPNYLFNANRFLHKYRYSCSSTERDCHSFLDKMVGKPAF